MKTEFFLTVNFSGSIKSTKTRPNLNWDEISIKMNLEIPDMLFKKPQLTATITVPESAASPKEIEVEMQDNIQSAIETVTGLKVKLIVENE